MWYRQGVQRVGEGEIRGLEEEVTGRTQVAGAKEQGVLPKGAHFLTF